MLAHFPEYVRIGRELADLHLRYEKPVSAEELGVIVEMRKEDYTVVDKIRLLFLCSEMFLIHDTFMKKNFKLTKDTYAAQHKDELDTFNKAVRTLMKLNGSTAVNFSALDAEFSALQSGSAELRTQLETLQPDIVNQKGGTGKTTTCENLGIGLAMEGKKVLLVDADPQGSLTISMGWQQPDELPTTLSTLMAKAMNDQSIPPGEGVLHHAEGVDLIPANIELAGLEVSLVNCMNREKMLKQVLEGAKHEYDFILLDCTPSLGMLTVNALAAADTTLIPVQAQYLSAKGLEQLLQTVQKVRRQINPKLKIEGILLTMTDSRTNYGQQIDNLIRGAYGSRIKVFDQTIPRSVRAAETSAVGKSIFQHDPKGKVAEAYRSLTKEVMANAERQLKRVAERGR